MDEDLLALIRELAEVPTGDETPGSHPDDELDELILKSRAIVRRETPHEPPVVKKRCGNPHCGCASRLAR